MLLRLPRSSARVAWVVAALLLAPLAGCGGADAPTAESGTTAEDLVAPVGGAGVTTPETAAEGKGTVTAGAPDKGVGDFSAPKGADAPGIPRAPASKGIRVESADGTKPRWIAKAYNGDEEEFCLHLAIPGPFDPDPVCQNGELLALQFFGDDASGPAVGTVVQAPLSRREATTQMVVAGLASGDARKVRVRYGTKIYDAKLSDRAVDLPIDQEMARALSGATRAQIDRLPDPVAVRAFGVSFPREAGNPPRVVTPETPHPVDGVVTLQLS